MRFLACVVLLCLLIRLRARQPVPEIRFQAQADFFKLPPDLYFGEVAGVAVNSSGHICLPAGARRDPPMAPRARSCWNLTPTADTFARSAIISRCGAMRMR